MKMILKDSQSPVDQPDNVAWAGNGRIYIATDGSNGAIWEIDSNGNDAVKVASAKNKDSDHNPSGVVDISSFVGYEPGSILLASTMGCDSSMSVLINPDATLVPYE